MIDVAELKQFRGCEIVEGFVTWSSISKLYNLDRTFYHVGASKSGDRRFRPTQN